MRENICSGVSGVNLRFNSICKLHHLINGQKLEKKLLRKRQNDGQHGQEKLSAGATKIPNHESSCTCDGGHYQIVKRETILARMWLERECLHRQEHTLAQPLWKRWAFLEDLKIRLKEDPYLSYVHTGRERNECSRRASAEHPSNSVQPRFAHDPKI